MRNSDLVTFRMNSKVNWLINIAYRQINTRLWIVNRSAKRRAESILRKNTNISFISFSFDNWREPNQLKPKQLRNDDMRRKINLKLMKQPFVISWIVNHQSEINLFENDKIERNPKIRIHVCYEINAHIIHHTFHTI